MNFIEHIILFENISQWRDSIYKSGRKLVVTNGCFDLLHIGHISYLEKAKDYGDLLIVGINGDNAVRQLKGENRPINSEFDRAAVLASLKSVDYVCIFQDKTATKFLEQVKPDIYVKGGDYTLDTLNQEERNTVEGRGGKVLILPLIPGKSTTSILKKMSSL